MKLVRVVFTFNLSRNTLLKLTKHTKFVFVLSFWMVNFVNSDAQHTKDTCLLRGILEILSTLAKQTQASFILFIVLEYFFLFHVTFKSFSSFIIFFLLLHDPKPKQQAYWQMMRLTFFRFLSHNHANK